jgi:hypothetical protein
VQVFVNHPPELRDREKLDGFEYVLPLASIRWARLKATMGVAFAEGVGFEYILPLPFP